MFENIIIVLFLISFFLAINSARKIGEKPKIGDVKKSLDKHRVIFKGQSSSK